MQKTKKILIILIYIGVILLSTKVYAKTGKAISETVRIRKEKSTTSSVVALVSQGEEVEIIEEKGDWYKVTYKTHTGYIRKDMISVEEKENTTSNENKTNTTSSENTVADQNQEDEKNETQNMWQDTNIQENNTIENTINTTTSENELPAQDNQNEESNVENDDGNIENEIIIGYKGKIESNIQIKILPSINSSIIGEIKENSEITVTDIINKWCYIENEEVKGWTLISKLNEKKEAEAEKKEETSEPKEEENSNLNETTKEEEKNEENTSNTSSANSTDTEDTKEEEKQTVKTKYVSTETLNVRKKPENNSEIVDHVTLNTEVTVIEEIDESWSKIKTKNIEGYVASKYLSNSKTDITSRSQEIVREKPKEEQSSNTSTTTKETTNNSTKGQEVVSYAKQYLGSKYVSGGTSPKTGFDCSGFTYYVYKHFGITLNRTSTAQNSNGIGVSKSDLKAGDLVIFNNSLNSKVGHVGIYIGGNSFIHAANSTKGVITTSLSEGYYSSRYVGGRRIIN